MLQSDIAPCQFLANSAKLRLVKQHLLSPVFLRVDVDVLIVHYNECISLLVLLSLAEKVHKLMRRQSGYIR